MANRKGEYFRRDKLVYPEILDLDAALDELQQVSLVETGIPPLEDAIALCRKDELAQVEVSVQVPKSAKRDQLADAVMESGINPVDTLSIETVRVAGMPELQVIKLLFFGNFHQDMTEFVLHELVSPFESYDLTRETSLFQDRGDVDELVRLQELSRLSHDVIAVDDTGDTLVALLTLLGERPVERLTGRRYDRVVNRIARQLERLNRQEDALEAYHRTRRAPSRERRARLLATTGQVEAALELCSNILVAPQEEDELEFAAGFGSRLARKHKVSFEGPGDLSLDALVERVPQSGIRVPRVHDRVELSALAWYLEQGFEGWYVENVLFRSLFGLAFWDIIFAPVPGVFFHPFQRGPDDLYTPDFVENRFAMIEARLTDIADRQSLQMRVNDTFDAKFGIANQFVAWQWLDQDLSKELLDRAISTIPGEHLVMIFRRLLADLKHNTSGLPDLILFSGDDYRLIEIKGPGDKLQKNQGRWFRYFQAHQIPAEVVDVTYLP